MSSIETETKRATVGDTIAALEITEPTARKVARASPKTVEAAGPAPCKVSTRYRGILPLLITILTLAGAAAIGIAAWDAYMGTPWTRDGTVRAYVVTMAPQVAGQIVELPVTDNQFVHKGDLLLLIDPTDYRIAVQLAEAAVQQTQVNAGNAEREAQRRQELTTLAVTVEEKQTYASTAIAAQAEYQQAVARLNQARINLGRTEIHAPVNGWVTNLSAQLGDYATVGQNQISLINADSFWVDG
jgi:multidrug resistance efflux pump